MNESLSRLTKPAYLKMDKKTTQAYESFAEVFDKERHPKQSKITDSQTFEKTTRSR